MKKRFLLLAASLVALSALVNGQTKLVEKVTKQGNEIVIPYENMYWPTGLPSLYMRTIATLWYMWM